MTNRQNARGRLIAIDGHSGAAINAAARGLVIALRGRKSGLSTWDSSGIFTELAASTEPPAPSSRTLTLLYAADLAFRIRWQIAPALDAGTWVVAAPYIETAVALGVASGLGKRWLVELFEFAPKPGTCYQAHDREPRQNSRARDGYPEFFRDALRAHGRTAAEERLREGAMDYLAQLERRGRCERLTEAALADLRTERKSKVRSPKSEAREM